MKMTLYAFDGTWNSDEVDDIQDTNVVRFKELYVGNNSEYLEGVGTRFGKIGEILGGLFGAGGKTRIDEMYDELCENWKTGDQVIDIIGFSRGAALAVHFANKIGEEGISVSSGRVDRPRVRFLGLWDIVGSFGLSFNNVLNFQAINLGWKIDTVHQCVEHCFHAMALNERREAFQVTRLDPEDRYDNISEVWFRGVHSDIGGGNENVPRSNIALQWMLTQARNCGLPIDNEKAKRDRYATVDRFAPISPNKDVKIDARRPVNENDKVDTTALPYHLKVGEAHTCKVIARSPYNWSGVTLSAGGEYTFSVPADSTWKDDDIECGPEGWKSEDLPSHKEAIAKALERFRRADANWFALIGALEDEDNALFVIGDGSTPYTAPKEADLYLLANDMMTRYGNNDGYLMVTIKRTA